jgi:hypothetical protein
MLTTPGALTNAIGAGTASSPITAFEHPSTNIQRPKTKKSLTLTLSRPTGEGIAHNAFGLATLWFAINASTNSPSPTGWERAGVRAPLHFKFEI